MRPYIPSYPYDPSSYGGFQGAGNFVQNYVASTCPAQSPQIITYGLSYVAPFITSTSLYCAPAGTCAQSATYVQPTHFQPAQQPTTSYVRPTTYVQPTHFQPAQQPTTSYVRPTTYVQQPFTSYFQPTLSFGSPVTYYASTNFTTTAPFDGPYKIRFPSEHEKNQREQIQELQKKALAQQQAQQQQIQELQQQALAQQQAQQQIQELQQQALAQQQAQQAQRKLADQQTQILRQHLLEQAKQAKQEVSGVSSEFRDLVLKLSEEQQQQQKLQLQLQLQQSQKLVQQQLLGNANQEILNLSNELSKFAATLSQQQREQLQHVETLGQVSREMSAINVDLIEVKRELTREESESQNIITEQQEMIKAQQRQLLQPPSPLYLSSLPSLSPPPSPPPPSPQQQLLLLQQLQAYQLEREQREPSVEKPESFDYSNASRFKTEDLRKVLESRRKILFDYRNQLNQTPPSTSTSSPQASLQEAFNERREVNPRWNVSTM